jgi:hypothetical protein
VDECHAQAASSVLALVPPPHAVSASIRIAMTPVCTLEPITSGRDVLGVAWLVVALSRIGKRLALLADELVQLLQGATNFSMAHARACDYEYGAN